MQYDLLMIELNDLIVTEADKSTVGTVISEQEFPIAVFDERVLARCQFVLNHQIACFVTPQQHAP